MDASPPTPRTTADLPNELLIQIASHLDTAAPSKAKFAHEPSTSFTASDDTPLKDLSLVSWRWRKFVLPILFRYTRIPLDQNPQWVLIDARILDSMLSQLTTLSAHELQIYIRMRQKCKTTGSAFAFNEVDDGLLITGNLCRVEDGDVFLKELPHILWFPHLPRQDFAQFSSFVNAYQLKVHIKSVVLYTDKEYDLRHVPSAEAHLDRVVKQMWSQVFSQLDPTRVVVAAPPVTIAGLLDVPMLSPDAWAFSDMKLHYIELAQSSSQQKLEHVDDECRPWTALIHCRPWTHLAYNEGSTITAYSTYEYHLKQSPNMLYFTLLRLAKEAQDCCNLRSFSFTGVFPFHTNISTVIRTLQRIQTLESVAFQLAPGAENGLLDAPKRMGRAQPSDLWLEWNECYKTVAAFLGTYEWKDGARFFSADCSVEGGVKSDVEEYVEALQKRGQGWRNEGDGVWVRDFALDDITPAVFSLAI